MTKFFDALQNPAFSGNFIGVLLVSIFIGISVIQGISMLLTQIFGITQLKLGPLFIAFGVGAIFMIFWRFAVSGDFTLSAIFMILALAGAVLLLLMYLPDLVPTLFQASVLDLKVTAQSILPLP